MQCKVLGGMLTDPIVEPRGLFNEQPAFRRVGYSCADANRFPILLFPSNDETKQSHAQLFISHSTFSEPELNASMQHPSKVYFISL